MQGYYLCPLNGLKVSDTILLDEVDLISEMKVVTVIKIDYRRDGNIQVFYKDEQGEISSLIKDELYTVYLKRPETYEE